MTSSSKEAISVTAISQTVMLPLNTQLASIRGSPVRWQAEGRKTLSRCESDKEGKSKYTFTPRLCFKKKHSSRSLEPQVDLAVSRAAAAGISLAMLLGVSHQIQAVCITAISLNACCLCRPFSQALMADE